MGDWENEGECIAEGDDPACGPGSQLQRRSCVDGSQENCTREDIERAVTCLDAGSVLPPCPKILGNWTNHGECQAEGEEPSCGPGNQLQTRTCVHGTLEKCTNTDLNNYSLVSAYVLNQVIIVGCIFKYLPVFPFFWQEFVVWVWLISVGFGQIHKSNLVHGFWTTWFTASYLEAKIDLNM